MVDFVPTILSELESLSTAFATLCEQREKKKRKKKQSSQIKPIRTNKPLILSYTNMATFNPLMAIGNNSYQFLICCPRLRLSA